MADISEEDEEFASRPRGLLNRKERLHLMGYYGEAANESKAAARQREYRIRQHLYHAIIDFNLLNGTFDSRTASLFDGVRGVIDEESESDDEELRQGIEALFSYLYRALSWFDDNGLIRDMAFHTALSEGVRRAVEREYASKGYSAIHPIVTFDVYHNRPVVPMKDVRDIRAANRPLHIQEILHLYFNGDITPESAQKLLERVREESGLNSDLENISDSGFSEYMDTVEARRKEQGIDMTIRSRPSSTGSAAARRAYRDDEE